MEGERREKGKRKRRKEGRRKERKKTGGRKDKLLVNKRNNRLNTVQSIKTPPHYVPTQSALKE